MPKFRFAFLVLLILNLPLAILSVHAQGANLNQETEWTKAQKKSAKVSGDLVALQKEYTVYRQANIEGVFQPSNSLLRGLPAATAISAPSNLVSRWL